MLRLACGFLVWLVGATAATAQIDCARINSRAVLEASEFDDILDCVKWDPELIGAPDASGHNLLMTAVSSNIDPFDLDALLNQIPADQLDTVLEAKDQRGWSLGHIAAAEAIDPGVIFVLSSYGVSFLEETASKGGWLDMGTMPLHVAAAREDGWPIIAALLAIGMESYPDQNDHSPLEVALERPETSANAILLSEGRWPAIYMNNFEPVLASSNVDCTNFLTTNFFSTANEADVAACLSGETKFESVDQDGNTILHLAAAHSKDARIIDLILSQAVDPKALVEKRNSSKMTALHLAAKDGPSPDAVAHLLAWGADPNALFLIDSSWISKNRGISALHLAASRNDDLREDIILNLLAFRADTMVQDVDARTENSSATIGRTPLHRAVLRPDRYIELMLLEAQFSQEGLLGGAFRALVRGHLVKQIGDDEGRTVLHMSASREADFVSLDMLLWYGFSVDEGDNQGNTPLMFAAQNFTDADNFRYLLNSSKSPCKKSKSGVTVEGALRGNTALMEAGAGGKDGTALSLLAEVKIRCP